MLLTAGAIALGSGYSAALRQSPARPEVPGFSQRVFGAALMRACGRGYTTPVPGILNRDPAAGFIPLQEFLAGKRASIACDEVAAVPVDGLDGLQRASRYLLMTVAGAWIVSGPTWAGIDRLMGVMFGASILLAYAACRPTLGRGAAAAVALLLMISPLHLQHLVDVRDYSKAPFFLLALAVIALVVTRPFGDRVLIALTSATGAVLGFGFGMRTDVAINVALLIGALLVFLPGSLRATWRVRLRAAAWCAGAFLLVAAPLLPSFETRSSPWHVALLGYAHNWDGALGVTEPPYETGYYYSDSYVATQVDAYWGRRTNGTQQVSVGLPGYAEASRAYYMATLTTFPADAAIRAWGAVIGILQLPFSGVARVEAGFLPSWLARVSGLAQRALALFEGVSVWLFVAVVLGISAVCLRRATMVLGLALALCAYPAIQFQPRHIFHLEIIPLWALAFAVAWLVTAARRRAAAIEGASAWKPAVFAVVLVLAVVLPVAGLRAYQQGSAGSVFTEYLNAERVPIAAPETALPDGIVRLAAGHDVFARPRGGRSMYSELLVVDADRRCGLDSIALTFRYAAGEPALDFTRSYEIDLTDAGPTRTVFPVFETGAASPDPQALAFAGVEVLPSERACITAIGRLAAPDRIALLLPAVLRPDWQERPLYERLRWEGDAVAGPRVSYWSPAPLGLDRPAVLKRAAGAAAFVAPVDYQARIARLAAAGSLAVNGRADSAASYLVAWKAAPFDAASVVVIEGRIDRGGLTLGLVDATGWVSKVDIATAGAFRAAIQPPAGGAYQLVIANNLRDGSLKTRFDVSRIVVINRGA